MNVANLELCKELYKLSGWMGTPLLISKDGPTMIGPIGDDKYPAYDLGYLLRKLRPIFLSQDDKELAQALRLMCQVKSPEDSLAKLAIELFKQGVLKAAKPANSLTTKQEDSNG